MRVFHCDDHPVPLPPGHQFPIAKYARLRERLVAEGVLRADQLHAAPPAPEARLLAVHDAAWVRAVLDGTLSRDEERRIGFPWSRALVGRTLASAGGTLAAAFAAQADGLAGVLAGGTHHAHRGFGAGFCAFNDLAVAARALLDDGRAARVAVLDLDVHQGDGTARIFEGEERVLTVSVHGAGNFPGRKATSDLDLALPDGAGDDAYLAAVDEALAAVLAFAPDAVLYQGGVDPLAEDRLGKLAVTLEGLFERDRRCLSALLARGVPTVLTLGGGYANPLDPTLAAHVGTYRAALGRTASDTVRPAPHRRRRTQSP